MMLQELRNIRQIPGEGIRRWFVDDDLELILWYNEMKTLEGFQICYDKLAGTRTVTWKMVTTAEGERKSILLSDGPYNRSRLIALTRESAGPSADIDDGLRKFILDRLESHGA